MLSMSIVLISGRIAIARALLKDPKILILDEATRQVTSTQSLVKSDHTVKPLLSDTQWDLRIMLD